MKILGNILLSILVFPFCVAGAICMGIAYILLGIFALPIMVISDIWEPGLYEQSRVEG